MNSPFSPTSLIWWRYGKELENETPGTVELRLNPPEIVQANLDSRAALFKKTPQEQWRWYQVSDALIVERNNPPHETRNGSDTRYYYLLKEGYGVIENFCSRRGKIWYIHLADFFYDQQRATWVMKDMFVDIIAPPNLNTFWIIDLDDLATALDIGLVDAAKASDILRRTESLAYLMRTGRFPTPLVEAGRAACRALGWQD